VGVLPGPYEILDLQDRESRTFSVERWEQGRVTIKTDEAPEGKEVEVCRIWVQRGDKPTGAPYWDITSKTLCVQILPLLMDPVQVRRRFTVTAHGVRPRKRFSLEVA